MIKLRKKLKFGNFRLIYYVIVMIKFRFVKFYFYRIMFFILITLKNCNQFLKYITFNILSADKHYYYIRIQNNRLAS